MAVTTTYHGAARQPKFTWSYSRLKNFEACPKRHWEIDLAKNFKEEESENLLWGGTVHKALADRCGPNQTPLPPAVPYEGWAQRVLHGGGVVTVEENLALTENFTPCGYFDHDVWFRAKGDFTKIMGDIALTVDWKTGKVLEDSVQLALVAACLFAKHPQLKAIRSSFIWLKEDAETSEVFYREDMPNMWRGLWPRIEALKQAFLQSNYPPLQGRLCRKWCPVTSCPHHGK